MKNREQTTRTCVLFHLCPTLLQHDDDQAVTGEWQVITQINGLHILWSEPRDHIHIIRSEKRCRHCILESMF
jgi:hypothetical protein